MISRNARWPKNNSDSWRPNWNSGSPIVRRNCVQSRERLRELATELTLTEQRERRRLAGELHDYLAQLLVLMRMKIRQAAPRIPDERATSLLKEADHAITESLNYTRSLVAELAPPALQEFGLLEGFAWLAEQMQTHGLTVEIKKGMQRVVIPDDQAVLVFQSVRELLFNVLKHAGTGQAELSVEIERERRIRHDGDRPRSRVSTSARWRRMRRANDSASSASGNAWRPWAAGLCWTSMPQQRDVRHVDPAVLAGGEKKC